MKEPVGHVIRILDNYRLIIDAGCSLLKEGDTIEVFLRRGNITDPQGNDLGPLIIVKDRLEVTQTEDYYSICEKKQNKTIKKPPFSELVVSPLLREQTEIKRVPLNVDESAISPIDNVSMKIEIGDCVRKT